MSGKSTYIRSLALMTVMAQIGCFIPAQYASFPIVHQLFARVATTDDLDANVSTFAAEMREMAFILRHVQPRGMVLVDELGRGTSTTDGLAIAVALAEALLASNALVWFATHFHDLARILSERSGVINLHLAADITADASKMTMLYQIAEGPVPDRRYGLALAKLVDLPPAVLVVANTVSETMERLAQRRNSPSRAVAIARKRKLLLSLREQLLIARNGTMNDQSLRAWLIKLQENFTLRMATIDQEVNSISDTHTRSELAEDENQATVSRTSEPRACFSSSRLGSDVLPVEAASASEPILIESDTVSVTTDSDSVVLV